MDVYRNLSFGLKIRGVEDKEIRQRVSQASKILGIEELLGRKPRQLSGGQMQRVALGRAIVREPDLFLFDEPLSNLDAKLRVKMRVEISRLHNELKSTTVYVTHDQVEAMTLGDRIVVMKDGVVNQVGTPLEVYDDPANRFVAGFIGSPEMNFIDGDLSNGGENRIFTSENREIRIDLGPVKLARKPEGKVTLGVRPEHLRFVSADDSSNRLKVEVIEHLGFQTLVMGKAGDLSITALVDRTESMKYGMSLGVTMNPGHIHLFDGQTGVSLTRRG
jgi:ABC-type sugar transport system ATPase subunit